ncbi:MAG: S1 family peptidase [Turicibacter sp.]|nr:S1 family peptidase [Turicibacter sp.]
MEVDGLIYPNRYSYKELLETKEKIEVEHLKNPESEIFSNVIAYGISDKENLVFVEMEDLSKEKIQQFIDDVVDSSLVVFRQSERIEAQATMNPGGRVTNNWNSTAGFRCLFGNIRGFIMSGHGSRLNDNIMINNSHVGTVIAWRWQGSVDAAFVQVVNNVELSNLMPQTNTAIGPAIATSIQGMLVFQIGISTGLTSGTVTATNVNITVTQPQGNFTVGVPMTNLVRATYNATSGDSGGPVYQHSGNQRNILGIHVASGGHYGTANNIRSAIQITPF